MEKIIVGPAAKGAVHRDATVKENLQAIATRLSRKHYPLTLTSCANSIGPVSDRSLTIPIPGP